MRAREPSPYFWRSAVLAAATAAGGTGRTWSPFGASLPWLPTGSGSAAALSPPLAALAALSTPAPVPVPVRVGPPQARSTEREDAFSARTSVADRRGDRAIRKERKGIGSW